MQTAFPSFGSRPPGLWASDMIPSESSPIYATPAGALKDRASSGRSQVSPGPVGAELSLTFTLVDPYGNSLLCPITKCITYEGMRNFMLERLWGQRIRDAILNDEFDLEDAEMRIIQPLAWQRVMMKHIEEKKSGKIIRIVVMPPLFFTLVVENSQLWVKLPVNSCRSIQDMRGTIVEVLYWLRRDTNTIEAVEEGRYRLEDQKGVILPPVCFNYLSGMTVKLITSASCDSVSPTPPPTPAPPRASSLDPHPPPPLVTMTEIPVIVVDRESLLRIGGYGSGCVSIVTVAKAASEYLDRGHFEWKKEAKTLLDRAKKAARVCINGMDDTNRGGCTPGTMRQLQLVINLLEQVEYQGLRGLLQTFSLPNKGSDYYTISIRLKDLRDGLPVIDCQISREKWHQGSGLVKFLIEDGEVASEDDGEVVLEDDGELI